MAEYIKIRSVAGIFLDAYKLCQCATGEAPKAWVIDHRLWSDICKGPGIWYSTMKWGGYVGSIMGVPVVTMEGAFPTYLTNDSVEEWV